MQVLMIPELIINVTLTPVTAVCSLLLPAAGAQPAAECAEAVLRPCGPRHRDGRRTGRQRQRGRQGGAG